MKYKIGSIFRLTEEYEENNTVKNKLETHVILVKTRSNNAILISLINGNRWSDKELKLKEDTVIDQSSFFLYFKNFLNVKDIEYLGHCSQIDYESLPTI